MNTRRSVAFFATIAIVIFINACSKNTDDKNASCRIVTATEVNGSSTNTINVTYDNDGRISTLNSSGSGAINKVFTYSGNTIIINVTQGGAFYGRDSITLNDKGRPTNIRQYSNVALTNYTNYALEYNGDQLLKYLQSTQAGGIPTTVTVTTTNGNVTKVVTPSATVDLEYFTDKNVQRGDYLEFSSLLQYGVNIYPHKNLIKSLNQGTSITNFNYEMNDEGLVEKITTTSGSSSGSLTYQYQCN